MNDQQRAAMIRPRGKSEAPHMIAAYRAMQMALEALETTSRIVDVNYNGQFTLTGAAIKVNAQEAITALREALRNASEVRSTDTGEPIYRCKSCGGVYIEPPTQCDCMPDVQEYDIGLMMFGDSPVVPQGEPVTWKDFVSKAHDVDGHCDVVLVSDLKRCTTTFPKEQK